jgi:hypothetical protein
MIKVGIDNEVIELKGEAEAALITQKAQDQAVFDAHEVALEVKTNAKLAAQSKLAALGLTSDEISALGF